MPRTYEIHPAIGIARVGPSDEFFPGPEPGAAPPAAYRDATGQLKRQAARFRVYECDRDAAGTLTGFREITPADGAVTWTVHVANRKGAAPRFAAGPGNRNNATGATAGTFTIDPGPRTLAGPNRPEQPFDGGKFKGQPVPLGGARTDAAGRLVVLGGRGHSDSVPAGKPIQGFADSDDWFDDVADGPVTASVTLADGTTVAPQPGWVIVGPFDFAPPVTNLITLYDVAFQAAVDNGWLAPPPQPSFTRDVRPILERAVGYRWVNRRARQGHGGGGPGNFSTNWAALSDPGTGPATASVVLERLRNPTVSPIPNPPEPTPQLWMPRLHDETNSDKVLPLTRVQYGYLTAWASGSHLDDHADPPPPAGEPDALTRAALDGCSGGAFFPGIEAGRIMADRNTYDDPFRPKASLRPGALTAGNALPWQADFDACEWEQHGEIGWWPAQRPDHVRTEASAALVDWDRGISGVVGPTGMVSHWHQLGVIAPRTVGGQPMAVETERTL